MLLPGRLWRISVLMAYGESVFSIMWILLLYLTVNNNVILKKVKLKGPFLGVWNGRCRGVTRPRIRRNSKWRADRIGWWKSARRRKERSGERRRGGARKDIPHLRITRGLPLLNKLAAKDPNAERLQGSIGWRTARCFHILKSKRKKQSNKIIALFMKIAPPLPMPRVLMTSTTRSQTPVMPAVGVLYAAVFYIEILACFEIICILLLASVFLNFCMFSTY